MSAYANKALNQKARLERTTREIKSAGHYTYIQMNSDEFLDLYVHSKLKQGKTRQEIADNMRHLFEANNSLPINWTAIYDWIKKITFQTPLIGDIKNLAILARDLGVKSGILSKYKVKVYSGTPTIIMEVTPSLKSHLTGTLYLAKNPKIFTIGLGYQAAKSALKGGVVFTLLASPVFRSIDQMLEDRLTWHHFVGGVAVDLTIALASVAASVLTLAAGAVLVGTTIAAVPLLIVVFVGGAIGITATFFLEDELNYSVEEIAQYLIKHESELLKKISRRTFISPEKQPIEKFNKIKRLFGIPNIGDML
ncbi:hypothetical protein [Pseudoalteromonas carrageenovora]|uniref:Uncharacterized protein n=1 Tax=Pseudoalteromonas carrageenovora IAM 12662 TaxID=1314868 RepID=A0ABR9ESG9_PSEVC|nr:hypothetical protein [Pseudoalteromonas carrageenovora]MBE0383468.1 hypothetical protein [Pseudoalteromonas carrageenovora IAM 12662]MDO6466120.1 hypothetical protein [Pseudoalteromonas carrageenovora]QBJ73355.1 hypothetical protein PC2016_3173 [Pseudoalteromonas carrageenovora]GEB73247.1 hypothetical protein PCA01_39570 [Pseudoalteromonas carrageenovora]